MGCKSSVIKELKKDIELVKTKYISKDELEAVKNDIKSVVSQGLELVMPVLESTLIQKTDILKQKQVSDLTKSFVTTTFKNVNDKLENLNYKVEEIDHKKINKPINKKNEDFIY